MPIPRMLRTLPLVAAAVMAAVWVWASAPRDPLPGVPKLVLWAWETPQDLRFLQPGAAAVAYLSKTVWLDGTHVHSRPRLQPLRYRPGTDLIAVVRLESAGHGLPGLEPVVSAILPATGVRGLRALQIDFDARQSERDWYARLLAELRHRIEPKLPLTITALESWCETDPWIARLPVAEATPMLFRMGAGERPVSDGFGPSICRSSLGVSTDELPARVARNRRLYFFHPGPWTAEAYDAAAAQARRWSK